MIVTYGGHGGDKCGAQLNEVLHGLRMVPVATRMEWKYPDAEFALRKAFPGADLGLDATLCESAWAGKRTEIVSGFEELVKLLSEKPEAVTS